MQPGWYADPSGRHELRYHNGSSWTNDVADDGTRSFDPLHLAPAPVPAPARPAADTPSGTATAAFVLGIVSAALGALVIVFYVAVVCGILALVFAFVSRRDAAPAGATARRARIATVLGVVGIALGIAGGALYLTVVGDLIDDIERVAPISAYDLEIERCDVADGDATVSGTLVNHTGEAERFTIRVEFVDPLDRSLVAEARAVVEDAQPELRTPFAAAAVLIDPVDAVECVVTRVSMGRPLLGV